MEDFLFVYGTLRSEFENLPARHLRANARLVGPGTVQGSIFKIRHYPAFRPMPGGTVQGELYCLADPARTLALLDQYEGYEFVRLRVEVSTGNSTWIYQYRLQPPESSRIESGDFSKP